MMYEMYVQTRDVYTANKDGVSIFTSTWGQGTPFQSMGLGTGLEWGTAQGACSPGTHGPVWRQGEGLCVFHLAWAREPREAQGAPKTPTGLTFLGTRRL